jgi:glycosyltransferase involved in cell wall biosynthesis
MNRKKRILMCAESHSINSGFGLYTREILSRLYQTNKYELAELSCYNTGQSPRNVPWKVYPNAVDKNHKDHTTYSANAINAFGQWRFDKTVLDFRPDIVFDIRDFWMMSFQEISPLRKYYNWVVAPTVDSLPQKNAWLQVFKNADMVLAHTDWAVQYLADSNRNITVGPSVADSVDTNRFCPINYGLSFHRAKMLCPQGFIIGSVMRNQKRKLIPNLMDVVKKLILYTRNSNIYLYLHTSYPENAGWDIPDLLQEYDMHNNTLFSYICKKCRKVFVSKFQGPKRSCPFCETINSCIIPNVIDGLSDQQMVDVYNLFDIYVQYAICEGLGIPQLEAASCGIPLCSVDYSAMSEVTSKLEAYKISYALFKELETGAMRAIPNDSELLQTLYRFYELDDKTKDKIKQNIRSKIIEHYSWDKTASTIETVFDKIEPKNNWDDPLVMYPEKKVPNNLSNRNFIKFLVYDVINDPYLWQTNFIQEIIKNLDDGYEIRNNVMNVYTKENAVKTLETYMNNKNYFEKIRSGEVQLNDDFINYANQ